MNMESSVETWQPRAKRGGLAEAQMAEPFEYLRSIRKENLNQRRVQSTSTIAMLKPETGSRTISNCTKTLVL